MRMERKSLNCAERYEVLKETPSLPQMIRSDNGPEFISHELDSWCRENKITLAFIQPGKPTQNAFVERCNGNIRKELLNAYVFKTLDGVRIKAEQWKQDYNHHQPHAALNYKTPKQIYNELTIANDAEMLIIQPIKKIEEL